jgi:hypothetical protein
MDPDDIYFPEAEDIGPHAIAFAQLMFAHAEFEREVRSLQGAITNDLSFGEQRSNQWKARQRPERMAKLIKRHFGDDLQETEPIRSSYLMPSVLATSATSLLTVNGGASTPER